MWWKCWNINARIEYSAAKVTKCFTTINELMVLTLILLILTLRLNLKRIMVRNHSITWFNKLICLLPNTITTPWPIYGTIKKTIDWLITTKLRKGQLFCSALYVLIWIHCMPLVQTNYDFLPNYKTLNQL